MTTPDLLFGAFILLLFIISIATIAHFVWQFNEMKKTIHSLRVAALKAPQFAKKYEALEKELMANDKARTQAVEQLSRQLPNVHNWVASYGDRVRNLEETLQNVLLNRELEKESEALASVGTEKVNPSDNDKELWEDLENLDLEALKERQRTLNAADVSGDIDPLTYSREISERIQEKELARIPSRAAETVTSE